MTERGMFPPDLDGGSADVLVTLFEGEDPGVRGRLHAGLRHVVLDLGAVSEPVAVGDLGDLQAAAAELFLRGLSTRPGPFEAEQINRLMIQHA